MNNISRETFESMNNEGKLNVLFDYASDNNSRLRILEKKYDKRRKYDTAFAGFMGLIGGFLAFFGKQFIK